MKNAVIPNHSIIGIASVVTKQFFEEYTCIAGNPAKVIKTNVAWSGELEV
jgi:acetyltransferase-like isoleucine patch superfamily enzyme